MAGRNPDVLNPRNGACLGHLYLFHNRRLLGDETECSATDFENFEDMKTFLCETEEAIAILPVYGYDHSNLSIRCTPFSCSWDSGQLGYIWATKEDCLSWFKAEEWTQELLASALLQLEAEVQSYDGYINGDYD